MKPIIEFCVNNIVSYSQKATETLEKDRSLDVVEYNCLSYCTQCAAKPMCLVEGEPISAETPEELVKKVYQYMEAYNIV